MLRRDFLKLPAAMAVKFPTVVAASVERMFPTPGKQPNGLQAVPEGLWVLDQGNNHASLLEWETGQVLRDFPTETDRGSGITWDGEALWIASTYNRLLVRVDARTGKALKKYDSPGSGVVKWGPRGQHPQPTGAHGLEWRAWELWVAAPPAATIFVVDPDTGKVKRQFPAPGVRPHGLGWDPDGSLWCTESIYRSFFKMDPRTGRILRQLMLPPTAPESGGIVHVPHGMTVRQGHIWFSVAETGEVYRLPL